MANELNFEMKLSVKFNKSIPEAAISEHAIVFGGYTMTMRGRQVSFDFTEDSMVILSTDDTVLQVRLTGPDVIYDDTPYITESLLDDVTHIDEIFVWIDTSEATISIDNLHPVELTGMVFYLPGEDREIIVDDDVLQTCNFNFDYSD